MYLTLPTTLYALFTTYLWPFLTSTPPPPPIVSSSKPLTFNLRHLHTLTPSNELLFADISSSSAQSTSLSTSTLEHQDSDSFNLRIPSTRKLTVPRISAGSFQDARKWSRMYGESVVLDWREDQLEGPDVSNKEVLLTLAKMTSNSYFEAGDKDWYDLGSHWNHSFPFGWNPEDDGFRGHIFATDDNSTVVVSIKGTSGPWIAGGGGPTVKRDKLNDNLLFSCCCARVGPTWSTVCDCYSGGYKCDQNCVETALQEDSLFYSTGINLYNNVTYMYPDANIWVIGHSLGGALASLVGQTFGVPVVAFEAPGEALASRRLHLPSPPSLQHITHVYHTADPIAMGTCNGMNSFCAIAGYAMEARCHLGEVIRYDTVNALGWSVSLTSHPIKVVLDKILTVPWPGEMGGTKLNDTVPKAVKAVEVEGVDGVCSDCFNWEFGEFKNTTKRRWRWIEG